MQGTITNVMAMNNEKYTSPLTLLGLLLRRLLTVFKPTGLHTEEIASTDNHLTHERRSVWLRHLDCGSCNACELELNALSNPIYDSERFGIKFEASPLHADALILTGVFTRNLVEAAELTLEAMSEPKQIITVGDCANDGGIFKGSYAIADRPENIQRAIRGHVAGCPPTPEDILRALSAHLAT